MVIHNQLIIKAVLLRLKYHVQNSTLGEIFASMFLSLMVSRNWGGIKVLAKLILFRRVPYKRNRYFLCSRKLVPLPVP